MFGINFNNNKDSDVIKDAEKILNSEIMKMDTLESELVKELKSVGHMKDNLSLLKSNMISIRKLSELREKTIYEMDRESLNNYNNFNMERYQALVESLKKIDNEIFPLLSVTHNEAKRLHVEDAHILYAEEANRRVMNDIDNESKNIVAEIKIIGTKNESLSNHAAAINKEVQKIFKEKQAAELGNKSKMGF
jgi:hypothetical protein